MFFKNEKCKILFSTNVYKVRKSILFSKPLDEWWWNSNRDRSQVLSRYSSLLSPTSFTRRIIVVLLSVNSTVFREPRTISIPCIASRSCDLSSAFGELCSEPTAREDFRPRRINDAPENSESSSLELLKRSAVEAHANSRERIAIRLPLPLTLPSSSCIRFSRPSATRTRFACLARYDSLALWRDVNAQWILVMLEDRNVHRDAIESIRLDRAERRHQSTLCDWELFYLCTYPFRSHFCDRYRNEEIYIFSVEIYIVVFRFLITTILIDKIIKKLLSYLFSIFLYFVLCVV